jgi:hypothetical protein
MPTQSGRFVDTPLPAPTTKTVSSHTISQVVTHFDGSKYATLHVVYSDSSTDDFVLRVQ